MIGRITEAIIETPLFGVALTILTYWIGLRISRKLRLAIFNPYLISVLLIVAVLAIFGIPYSEYARGGDFIGMFLTPVTTILAVSIYRQREIVKSHFLPILMGTLVGSIVSVVAVVALSEAFGITDELKYSLVPKSVTTPIAVAIADSLGGIRSLTVTALIFTGVMGNVLAPLLAKLFRVKSRIATGVAIGTASHVIGTSKALEMGEDIGAMSGIALSFAGIITAVFVSLFF